MLNVRQRPELLLEPVERQGIEAQQRLEGDGVAPLAILRLVDDAHWRWRTMSKRVMGSDPA